MDKRCCNGENRSPKSQLVTFSTATQPVNNALAERQAARRAIWRYNMPRSCDIRYITSHTHRLVELFPLGELLQMSKVHSCCREVSPR